MAIIWVNSPVNCEVPGVRGCVLAVFVSPASAQHPELALREDWLGWSVWPQCSVKFNLFPPLCSRKKSPNKRESCLLAGCQHMEGGVWGGSPQNGQPRCHPHCPKAPLPFSGSSRLERMTSAALSTSSLLQTLSWTVLKRSLFMLSSSLTPSLPLSWGEERSCCTRLLPTQPAG